MTETSRARAARQLGQLLGVDAVGAMLDEVGDAGLRDLLLKALARTREIGVDAVGAQAMGARAAGIGVDHQEEVEHG